MLIEIKNNCVIVKRGETCKRVPNESGFWHQLKKAMRVHPEWAECVRLNNRQIGGLTEMPYALRDSARPCKNYTLLIDSAYANRCPANCYNRRAAVRLYFHHEGLRPYQREAVKQLEHSGRVGARHILKLDKGAVKA